MKLVRKSYSRITASRDKEHIFIFTDNLDRTSGQGKIPDGSSYSKRFGKTGLCYPSVTSAVLRGLENAFPITTQKGYKKGANPSTYNWTDDDFEEFKKVIDDDFEKIKEACVKYNADTVYFPSTGVLNGNISQITFDRTPILYNYIIEKEIELRDFNIEKTNLD
jgi:hypothetical protein